MLTLNKCHPETRNNITYTVCICIKQQQNELQKQNVSLFKRLIEAPRWSGKVKSSAERHHLTAAVYPVTWSDIPANCTCIRSQYSSL